MICPKCGNNVDDAAVICVNCGENLKQAPAKAPGKGMAVASLVLGIVSMLCFPPVTGTLGIVFGAVARTKGNKSPMTIAGIICGAVGIVLWIVMLTTGFSSLSFFE